MYTLFGDGRCVTFKKLDNGKLFHCVLTKEKVILTGMKGADRLYYLDTPRRSKETSYHLTQSPMSKLKQLHYSLGHLNYQAIKAMVQKGLIMGIKLLTKELNVTPPICPACTLGKATHTSFPPSKSEHANTVLGLVHSDLWGPAPVQTITGTHYVITFTDDKSRWAWVTFLKHKSDAFAAFKEWLIFAEKQTSLQLYIFHTDNGGEFLTKEWRQMLKDQGICHETTSPDTPEQNGDAECQNHTIFDRVRTVLIDAGLPLFLFAEAVNYIVHTKNHNSTSTLTNTTPYEVRFNKKPDISQLCPFGCKAYVYDHSPKRYKLNPRAFEGIFIGYADTQKAYQIYIPKKRAVICSAHVRFDVNTNMAGSFKAEGEIQFQYSSLKSTFQELNPEHSSSPEPASSSDNFILNTTPSNSALPKPVPELVPNAPPPDPPAHRPRQFKPPPPPLRAPSSCYIKSTNRGDSSRLQKVGPPNTVPFPTDSADTNAEPNADPGGAPANEEPDNQESANIAHGEEPKTHAHAMASPDAAEWLAAEHYELDQLALLDVYDLTLLPPGHSRTGCRWVYKIKRDTEGNIILYRARIVAQGFTQRPGEDFFKTFAPVAKVESIRLLLAIAAILDWGIHVIDVDSAFLNSTMPEDQTVYLSQPPGYVAEGKEDFVWKLGKALYGLKQSGHLGIRS